MDRLSIDFVSDIVCPWCALGYYRLKQAAADLDVELDIHWHPFELNPNMPAEGQDLYQHFGITADATVAAALERLEQLG